MKIHSQIKTARLSAGLSQLKLGELIGVAQSHVSAIEAGKYNLTLATLYKLANALNCDLLVHKE